VIVSDVVWDESARSFAIDIAVPVADPGERKSCGDLEDLRRHAEMLAGVTGLSLDRRDRRSYREDGSIVFGKSPV
jgi:hypothetical protein